RQRFAQRLSPVQALLQNQDNREHDLLDSNEYYQFQGGMLAASETLSGQKTARYHGDHSQPDLPKIRTLKEELNRVIRSRAPNPKWIEGVRRHGYKG
ncbi:cobaltochelatase subunit CobN, partial [Pseudomonas syringae pv. tagetis]|uniref:cobaltochelatase subunit CobN n=1 Tax=Pseudomonas syringae group genomosp. 7 TaxID=251699 RepID=UPI00376FE803